MTEEKFREMLADPERFSAFAAKCRREWELKNVVWFHGFANGKAIWKRERPPAEVVADPDKAAGPRYQHARGP